MKKSKIIIFISSIILFLLLGYEFGDKTNPEKFTCTSAISLRTSVGEAKFANAINLVESDDFFEKVCMEQADEMLNKNIKKEFLVNNFFVKPEFKFLKISFSITTYDRDFSAKFINNLADSAIEEIYLEYPKLFNREKFVIYKYADVPSITSTADAYNIFCWVMIPITIYLFLLMLLFDKKEFNDKEKPFL